MIKSTRTFEVRPGLRGHIKFFKLHQPSFRKQTQNGYQPDSKAKQPLGSHFRLSLTGYQVKPFRCPLTGPTAFPSMSHLWGQIRYWSSVRQGSHSEHWTPDTQGLLGVGEWGNIVLWDVRAHWPGALRQCRSGFSFGYRQICCSCIKGCSDDRGSCDFLRSPEVPGMPFSLHTKSPVFSQLLSVNLVKLFPHTWIIFRFLARAQHCSSGLERWKQSHRLYLTSSRPEVLNSSVESFSQRDGQTL